MGRPGGMCRAAGERYERGLRYTKDFGFGFDTPALLYETGGGFNRSAHSAGPGKLKWDKRQGKRGMGENIEVRKAMEIIWKQFQSNLVGAWGFGFAWKGFGLT